MFPDLFEYQDIFASQLTTAVFVYATLAMMLINAMVALAVSRPDEKHPRMLQRPI